MKVIKAIEIDEHPKLAIVASRFNEEISTALLEGGLERLKELEVDPENITVIMVPGAVEIPVIASKLAKKNKFDAIIAYGAVIEGETQHFDYVCDQVSQGCAQIMLEHDIPVIFGVLTTKNVGQARERCGGSHGHKGIDAVDAAMEMISVAKQVDAL